MQIKREGYWFEEKPWPWSEESPYPTPVPDPNFEQWIERQAFIDSLKRVENELATSVAYRGSSRCRFCDCQNGYHEFNFLGWQWPSGFNHYVREHNVRPSRDFEVFIATCASHLNSKIAGCPPTQL